MRALALFYRAGCFAACNSQQFKSKGNQMKKFILLAIAYVISALALFHQKTYALNLYNGKYPTLDEMAQNLALDLGSVEIVKWELFDYLLYPTAGQTILSFFLNGLGQGLSASPGNAGAGKAITDTNLTGAGVLPSPQAFWTEEIEVMVDAGSVSTANTYTPQVPAAFAVANAAGIQAGSHDINAILTTGGFQFSVGQKPYYQCAPLHRAPPTVRIQLDTAVANTSGTVGEVVKERAYATGDTLKLDPGVGIPTAMNFAAQMTWPVAIATPSGFNARIGVVLSGWLFRAVQ